MAVMLLAIALILWKAVPWQIAGGLRPQPVITAVGPTIEKLEALQELAVQKVTVSDVMVYRNGWTASWLVRGDGLISVPLKDSRIVDVDPSARTARIILASPRVLTARIDHEKTLYYDSKQALWNRVNPWGETYPEVAAEAHRHMQRLVEHAVAAPEHIDQARANAATVVRALYSGLDWKITVDWDADPDPVAERPASEGQSPGSSSPKPDAVKPKPSG